MADLYSNTDDGFASSGNQSSFAAARDHAGGSVTTNSSATSSAPNVTKLAGRGGGFIFSVTRNFYYFDTSGITGTVGSADIKIHGHGSIATGSAIAVKSTAFGGDGGTALAAGDFNSIVGYSSGASLAGNATDYSAAITSGWNNSGYNDLASTAGLRADIQNNDILIVCVMNYTNDYLNSEPSSSAGVGSNFTEASGTSKDPYIEYELATGYGNKVLGVTAGNIAKVDGVATANIEKVIGV